MQVKNLKIYSYLHRPSDRNGLDGCRHDLAFGGFRLMRTVCSMSVPNWREKKMIKKN